MLTDRSAGEAHAEAGPSHDDYTEVPQFGSRPSPTLHLGRAISRHLVPRSDVECCLDRPLNILVAIEERSLKRHIIRMMEPIDDVCVVGVSGDGIVAV